MPVATGRAAEYRESGNTPSSGSGQTHGDHRRGVGDFAEEIPGSRHFMPQAGHAAITPQRQWLGFPAPAAARRRWHAICAGFTADRHRPCGRLGRADPLAVSPKLPYRKIHHWVPYGFSDLDRHRSGPARSRGHGAA
ncbi:MAG TPA: hypothetical protein VNF99_01985 [Stellaceae bacterium]|nr:hypothetical protein [Stellaceae bacterium]